jgi:hypothetical protein
MVQSKMNGYGVPLDNRAEFTKLDWEFWVGAMGDAAWHAAIVDKAFDFANATPVSARFIFILFYFILFLFYFFWSCRCGLSSLA